MASLLPPQVVAMESFGEWEGDWRRALFPVEARVVDKAMDKRRREFAGVRVLARRSLRVLGVSPVPLVPGARGEPGWPPGVVGAMTHCTGYRAAAAARAEAGVAAVGIDAEPHARLSAEALEMVAGPSEHDHLKLLSERWPEVSWGCLLFSAKEAVFKAWYPLARCELGFLEAEVELWADHDRAGGFNAAVSRPGPFTAVSGRWRIARGVVATAVTVDATA
ncbi:MULTISPECIES: 4'-phosphopantetheinyl transferase family protein [Streptomyces]|uniref:4'-phosphopantetheinyl transferase family protein n=1 Tax=Streptomyces TaxID=1883 RepID=UPI000C1AACB9|nr:4'-phosphopantetheinyl transferase superfamily protein [Streptomyces sp. NBC_01549]